MNPGLQMMLYHRPPRRTPPRPSAPSPQRRTTLESESTTCSESMSIECEVSSSFRPDTSNVVASELELRRHYVFFLKDFFEVL